jgi:hypothetical protein
VTPKDDLGSIRLRLAQVEEEIGMGGVAHARAKHRSEDPPLFRQLRHLQEELAAVEHRLSKRIAALEERALDAGVDLPTAEKKAWCRGDEPTESVRTARKPGAE